MTKKREELYASGAMAAVQNDPSPVQNGSSSVAASDPNDVSIPYDAAARLAYTKAGSNGDFAAFKADYEKEAIAMVTAKKAGAMSAVQNDPSPAAASDPNDVSIPYDAAARLAFAAAGSDGDYAMFKEVYEQQMVAMVVLKKNQRESDVSIPYDAAARLAYTKAGSKGDFSAFKATYEKEAIAMVTAKKAALVK